MGAAALVTVDGDGRIARARIALTAVAPTIVRAAGGRDGARGRAVDGRDRRGGRRAAVAAAARPIDDVRASADYRRAMVAVVVAPGARRGADRAGRGEASRSRHPAGHTARRSRWRSCSS